MSRLRRTVRPPMRKEGARAQRVVPVRSLAYEEVARRVRRKGGQCELCDFPWEVETNTGLEKHHVFGRGGLPGIPQADCESASLILAICHDWPANQHHGCHERIHFDGDEIALALIGRARGIALVRFADEYGLQRELDLHVGWGWEPLEIMRELIRLRDARKQEEEQSA